MVGALHATPLPPPDAKFLKKEILSAILPKRGSLSVVVRSYKSSVTKNAHKFDNGFSWQPGFYDNIIYNNPGEPGSCILNDKEIPQRNFLLIDRIHINWILEAAGSFSRKWQ
jgi:hypothetical protein